MGRGGRRSPADGDGGGPDGTVHAQRGIDVFAYDGPTGALRGPVELAGGGPVQILQAVAARNDGGAVLLERVGTTTDLVWIDGDGNEVSRVDSGLRPTDRVDRMATDAAGVVLAAGTSVGDGVRSGLWVFEADGARRAFLSGEGLGAGTWDLALGMAVDRESRLAVSTLTGVQLYDADLRYVGTFSPGGIARGLAFEGNRLWGSSTTPSGCGTTSSPESPGADLGRARPVARAGQLLGCRCFMASRITSGAKACSLAATNRLTAVGSVRPYCRRDHPIALRMKKSVSADRWRA